MTLFVYKFICINNHDYDDDDEEKKIIKKKQ